MLPGMAIRADVHHTNDEEIGDTIHLNVVAFEKWSFSMLYGEHMYFSSSILNDSSILPFISIIISFIFLTYYFDSQIILITKRTRNVWVIFCHELEFRILKRLTILKSTTYVRGIETNRRIALNGLNKSLRSCVSFVWSWQFFIIHIFIVIEFTIIASWSNGNVFSVALYIFTTSMFFNKITFNLLNQTKVPELVKPKLRYHWLRIYLTTQRILIVPLDAFVYMRACCAGLVILKYKCMNNTRQVCDVFIFRVELKLKWTRTLKAFIFTQDEL